ncbi:hypothetical protein [Paenibacillus tuaregi]|uniref:hypothetical protein n=1 Tax=Paenibacillus tuaregi TaxID=1816681 RepID=UPI0011DDFB81|nr:hypothetical protein [Paenibacillus tuaregi]
MCRCESLGYVVDVVHRRKSKAGIAPFERFSFEVFSGSLTLGFCNDTVAIIKDSRVYKFARFRIC